MSETEHRKSLDSAAGGERPFKVILPNTPALEDAETAVLLDDELSMAQIEAAYLQALETAEAVEALLPQQFAPPPSADEGDRPAPAPVRTAVPLDAVTSAAMETEAEPTFHLSSGEILEAVLFVGGEAVTARKLCDLLGGSFTQEHVDEILESLNTRYAAEGRPYELSLGEGGYRLTLKDEFEPVRRKVYNQGPKEVKLAQDALEVLALIAYRQPVTRAQIEATEKPNVAVMLRQLLRRQLIALTRDNGAETYRTTTRFLDLFGLTSLDDLPQAADFNFK